MTHLLKTMLPLAICWMVYSPAFSLTWYSQGSGVWGNSGTPMLWNTDPGGGGTWFDGTDFPTAADDLVVQAGHQIQVEDFAAVANVLDMQTLTLETDAALTGTAPLTYRIHGAVVSVAGSINCPALTIISSTTAAFNSIKGSGTATLQTLSFRHSLPAGNVSIDLDVQLTSDFYPFDVTGTQTTGAMIVEKDKALTVQGSVYLDADALNGFSLNQYENNSDLIIRGKLVLSGTLKIGSDNLFSDLLVQVDPGGELQLSGGSIEGGAALWAATSVVNIEGTFATAASDPIRDMNTLFFVRMNANSNCRLEGGAGQFLDKDVAQNVYYNVELSGTGPKTLEGDLEISNDLMLGAILSLGNFDLYLSKVYTGGFFGSGLPVSGYSVDYYLETGGSGQLRMYIPAAGFGGANVFIPIGNGNLHQLFVTNNSTGSGYFDCRVESGVQPSGPGTSTNYVHKTWYFNEVGSFSNALNIQFFWSAADEQSNFDNGACWVSRHDGTNWSLSAPATADLISPYGGPQYEIVGQNISSFGTFSIASDGLLPVELLDFEAEATSEGHMLRWRTASELNNSHFEIEHSTDALNFVPLGQVPGSGTTQELQVYEWRYPEPPASPIHYYRLKQVDLDGQFTYSDILALEGVASLTPEIQLYPNPATEKLQVKIPYGGREFFMLRIFASDGKKMFEYLWPDQAVIQVPLADFPAGPYHLMGYSRHGAVTFLGTFLKKN